MNAKLDPMMERALIAEKRLSEALKLAESNGKLAHDTAIQLRKTQRERDNAISDWRQADTDSIRAIHERNEARAQVERFSKSLDFIRDNAIAMTKENIISVATYGIGGEG